MSSNKDNLEEEFVFEFYEDNLPQNLEPKAAPITEAYNEVNFEADLNKEQLEIVNNIKGPMLVIAGAGSGKTRTITYAVAKLLKMNVKPSEIMLVTFTNKAANEMIKRVESLLGKHPKGIWAGTFHAIANRFLRIYSKIVDLKSNYTILDESDSTSLMKLSIDRANTKELQERFPTAKMCRDILSYSINCNKTVKDVIVWRYNQFNSEQIIGKLDEVFKVYRVKKAHDGLLDFDDLLVYWNILLKNQAIAKKIAQSIKYVLVDEYQDTNYLQDEIIYNIVNQNPKQNVMAVGDDAQSIYAFRGANFKNILDFPKKYKNCSIYKITYNYRSVPEILDLANDSISHNKFQHQKEMHTTRLSGLKPFQVNVGDDDEQANFIAKQVLQLRSEGYELHEMAILIRSSFHSLKIELALQSKNIPYEVRAGVAFFEKAHIKDLLVHLKVIENPYDEVSWSRIFMTVQGIGPNSGEKIFNMISQTEDPIGAILDQSLFAVKLKGARIPSTGRKNLIFRMRYLVKISSNDDPAEVILRLIKLLEDYIKSKYPNWQDRMEDLKQLSVYAQNFPTISKFLETLSLNKTYLESKSVTMGNQVVEEKALVLSTIHRAKGLEWRVVFIPMLLEDFFPSSRSVGSAADLEEERRVFYVAITRAKDQLYLISPAIVQSYRGYQTVRLSPFVAELNPKVYRKSKVEFMPSDG